MDLKTEDVCNMKYGILFKADGTLGKVVPTKKVRGSQKFDWTIIQKLMNAQSFDFIKYVDLMVVLDQDATLLGKPLNLRGSQLVNRPVYGDVLFTHKKLMGM